MAPPDRAAVFAQRAQVAAAGVVGPAVIAASRKAVASVAAQTEAGYLRESAHDVAFVRANPGLVAALGQTQQQARAVVQDQALAALEDGYRTTLDGESSQLGLRAAITPADLAALAGHPIVDATAAEWGVFLAARLDWRLRSVATRAALGSLRPAAIPDQVDQAGRSWAQEVGRLAADAWHAGVTAARLAMAQALAR